MDDPNHKEGDKYLYSCENCGHIRGILDQPYYSTICTQCKESYKEDKIVILHEAHNMVNFFGITTEKDDHYLNMDVFEVNSWTMDNEISEPELYLKAYIKWDGCSHVTFVDEGYIHLCGKIYWDRHSEVMKNIYEYASKNIKRFDKSEM